MSTHQINSTFDWQIKRVMRVMIENYRLEVIVASFDANNNWKRNPWNLCGLDSFFSLSLFFSIYHSLSLFLNANYSEVIIFLIELKLIPSRLWLNQNQPSLTSPLFVTTLFRCAPSKSHDFFESVCARKFSKSIEHLLTCPC